MRQVRLAGLGEGRPLPHGQEPLEDGAHPGGVERVRAGDRAHEAVHLDRGRDALQEVDVRRSARRPPRSAPRRTSSRRPTGRPRPRAGAGPSVPLEPDEDDCRTPSAWARSIRPCITRFRRACSRLCMPSWVPVWIDEGIWWVFPSRMRLRMATVATMISKAATRPFLSFVGKQELRDHALEGLGQLHAHLLLLGGREGVDDAVDRLRRALGVKRREDEVPGLGGRQREADRLEVAHLADQDDVGVLPQGRPERGGERLRVRADLPLVHEAALGPVHELDRILERDDVLLLGRVDEVDHRRPASSTCPIRSGR